MAIQDTVSKFFVALFNRAPKQEGLDYWVKDYKNMVNAGTPERQAFEDLVSRMLDAAGTVDQLGADLNGADFIKAVYQNLFDRDPAADGLNYWTNELNSVSKGNVILRIIENARDTAEFQDKTLLENRGAAGVEWAAQNPDAVSPLEGNPNAYQAVDACTPGNLDDVISWINGDIPSDPRYYHEINDAKGVFTKENTPGAAQDDVFLVKKFKSADLFGDAGSDTLDFQKWQGTGGVSANLSTGTMTGVNADGTPAGMTFSWMENIRGTADDDTLIGNSDANILISQGVGAKGDTVDGQVGDDYIIFNTIEDIAKSTINGGQNTDTLEIVRQLDIKIGALSVAGISDVEILQVGRGKGDGNATAAATITVTDGTPLNTFKEIHGQESYDKKGNPTDDVIQSALDLDLSTVKLVSIEEVKAITTSDTTIAIGASTLADVDKVTGFTDGTTDLQLKGKAGEVFDLSKSVFTNIDTVFQAPTDPGIRVIANQTLVASMAKNDADDGFVGDFTKSTLQAAGIGLDLSVLADGDGNFKAIDFGTAKEVTVGNINDANSLTTNDLDALRTITGSVNNADLLRIKPDSAVPNVNQDLTNGGTSTNGVSNAIVITKVERLDFEEISTVAMDNLNLGQVDGKNTVYQISGDDDTVDIINDPDTNDANDNGTVIDAGYETDKGGLNLKGIALTHIAGLGNNVSNKNGTITIDHSTTWDSNFKSLDSQSGGTNTGAGTNGGSKQTIIAADAGSYDLSQIRTADAATVVVNNLDTSNDVFGNNTDDSNTLTITYQDKFVGANGDDIVKGGVVGFGYELGNGNDTFIGQNTANEVVDGGEGNDTIALGDNTQDVVISTVTIANYVGPDVATQVQGGTTGDFVRDGLTAGNFDGKGAVANGGAHDDVITSGKGNDVLFGGTGHDTLSAGEGNDVLSGDEGDDILSGGAGVDILLGGDGNDVIQGDAGEDYIYGGKGTDSLRGGTLNADGTIDYGNQDHFHFASGDSGTTAQSVDKIVDFLSYSRALADVAVSDGADGTAKDGVVSAAEAANSHDVLYLDWYLDDAAPEATGTALDIVGAAAVAAASGVSYDTLFANYDDFFASATSLKAAAEGALDKLYVDTAFGLMTAAGADYTSTAVQFEYGGKEYVAINAYVALGTGLATDNNFNDANDLIVELSGTHENWALTSDTDGAVEIVVTRWDTVAA